MTKFYIKRDKYTGCYYIYFQRITDAKPKEYSNFYQKYHNARKEAKYLNTQWAGNFKLKDFK